MENEQFLILHSDGREEQVDANHPTGAKGFWGMVQKEALKQDYRPQDGEPAYLEVCRRLGIAWEEMSDSGHMRFGPKGALVFDLLADYVGNAARSLGLPLFQVKGTNMFDLHEGPVAEHAALFGDRLYSIADADNGRKYVLRYAACHQQFAMIKHWQISHKHLPFAAYELADSYRMEQSGECMLAFRTRRLNMPDLHVFCLNEADAGQWFVKLHQRIMQEVQAFGQEYELLVNLSSSEAMQSNRQLLQELAQDIGRPLLLHVYPAGKGFYWTVNLEYHIIDQMGRAREIGTVQIDVGNAQRFGISYVDASGQNRHPVILHSALIGSIERFLYLVMDTLVKRAASGQSAQMPYWLAPEQIRLLPVSDQHSAWSRQLATQLLAAGIRAGVDDRPEKVGRKVRDAQADWVPYQVVIGDREVQGGLLPLAQRSSQQERACSVDALLSHLRQQQGSHPWRPLYFPAELSMRPVF